MRERFSSDKEKKPWPAAEDISIEELTKLIDEERYEVAYFLIRSRIELIETTLTKNLDPNNLITKEVAEESWLAENQAYRTELDQLRQMTSLIPEEMRQQADNNEHESARPDK